MTAWVERDRGGLADAWPPVRSLDTPAALLAVGILAATTAAGLFQQSLPESEHDRAQPSEPAATTTVPGRETMIAGYAGAPYTHASDVAIKTLDGTDFVVRGVDWHGKPFENPIYYGGRIIRWFGFGRFGAMIDYTHSKTISEPGAVKEFEGKFHNAPMPARTALEKIFYKLEFSHGHNMLTLNGLVRLPRLSAHLWPYAGAGGGVALPHTEIHLAKDNGRTYEYQYAGTVGQAVAGIEIRLPHVSLFIEYKLTYAAMAAPLSRHNSSSSLFEDLWGQFTRWRRGDEPRGTATTTLVSHQVISGLGIRFARNPIAP